VSGDPECAAEVEFCVTETRSEEEIELYLARHPEILDPDTVADAYASGFRAGQALADEEVRNLRAAIWRALSADGRPVNPVPDISSRLLIEALDGCRRRAEGAGL